MEKDYYVTWTELFETRVRKTRALYHIIPQSKKERLALIDVDHKQ